MHPYKEVYPHTPVERALEVYSSLGLHLFLTHSIADGQCTCRKKDCTSPGKHPATVANPHGVLDATDDLGELYRRLALVPYANIAIATGERSGIVVIDIDGETGYASIDQLERQHGNLPRTLSVLTGSGMHLYFRWPAGTDIRSKAGMIAPGVDQRANGGYVLAPPSRHHSGRQYEWRWIATDGNESLPARPAPLPSWLLELALGGSKVSRNDSPRAFIHRETNRGESFPGDGPISEGSRNDALASKAGLMRGAGFTEAEIETALLKVNTDRCKPPLDDEEVRKIAHSIARYPSTFNTPPRNIFSPIKIANGKVA